ncbi:MAG: diguanylate cyclase [Lautropia sp.]
MSSSHAPHPFAPWTRRLFGHAGHDRLQAEHDRLLAEVQALRLLASQAAQREADQRRMLDDAGVGVLVIDRFARIAFGNQRVAQWLGVPAASLAGRSILDLLPAGERAAMLDALASQRRGVATSHAGHLLGTAGTAGAGDAGDAQRPAGAGALAPAAPIAVRFDNSPVRSHDGVGGMLTLVTDLREHDAASTASSRREAELQRRIDAQIVSTRALESRCASLQALSRRQGADQATLQAMNAMLQSCTTPIEGASVVARFAQSLFDADAGSILLADDDRAAGTGTGGMHLLHGWGPPGESDENLAADDCWALRSGAPYPLSDEQASLRCRHLRLGEGRHAMCLPLVAQGRNVGMINLRAGRPPIRRAPGEDLHGLATAQLFATIAAQYCLNLKLRAGLEQQALRDPLTGLFNRRYFNEQLNIEFQRALRAKSPLALLMVDVDHFKRVNDRFGHDTGDRVLRDVAEVLSHGARAGDIVCRWGGEEFLILMPGSGGATARRRADEIRQRVKDRIEIVGGTRVGVSIGVAVCPDHARDPDGLIEVSERALLAAKGAGRNRVTLAVAGI